ncbi:hypothetical protein F5Y17DRAFT_449699, partial [Xylariaceae sp. FL0594]
VVQGWPLPFFLPPLSMTLQQVVLVVVLIRRWHGRRTRRLRDQRCDDPEARGMWAGSGPPPRVTGSAWLATTDRQSKRRQLLHFVGQPLE